MMIVKNIRFKPIFYFAVFAVVLILPIFIFSPTIVTNETIETVQAAILAPTLISYQESNWITRTGNKEVTGTISWQTGDVVVVVGGTEDIAFTLNTPTATGLTFSLVSSTAGNNNTGTYLWSAIAGSNGTSAVTSTVGGGNGARGISAFVYRGSSGLGNNAKITGSTAKTISLNRNQDNSAVAHVMAD